MILFSFALSRFELHQKVHSVEFGAYTLHNSNLGSTGSIYLVYDSTILKKWFIFLCYLQYIPPPCSELIFLLPRVGRRNSIVGIRSGR